MLARRKIGFCIIFVLFIILISNNALATKKITLSNLKILDLDGNVIPPKPDGTYPFIGSAQEFYFSFDMTNTGDEVIPSSYFDVYAPGLTPTIYIYEKLSSPTFELGLAQIITNHRVRVKIYSSTCPGIKPFQLYAQGSTPTLIGTSGQIAYEGGVDCASITGPRFEWTSIYPGLTNPYPALINSSDSYPTKVYGFKFTIKNTGSSFTGWTYTLTGRNIGILPDIYCTKTGTFDLAANEEITLEMPADSCPIRALGYIYLNIRNTNGVDIPISGYSRNMFYADIPAWSVLSYSYPFVDKLAYLAGETVNIFDMKRVVKNPDPSYQKTIPPGSKYHIYVKDVSGSTLYDNFIVIDKELAANWLFGNDPSYTTNFPLGSLSFIMTEPVPEYMDIYTEVLGPDPNNARIFSTEGYLPYKKRITLTPVLKCITPSNTGCSCSSTIIGNNLDIKCKLVKPDMVINKKYFGRFVFDNKLEPVLRQRFISVVPNPIQSIAPNFISSIEFETIPKPDSTTDTEYTFSFDCDLDKDGFNDIATCGGTDCNDNDFNVNPSVVDNSCNNINNDCDGSIDEDYLVTETTCGLGSCAGNTGQLVCTNGVETNTCDPYAGATAETCTDNTGYDGIDNNCDGTIDLDCTSYCDADSDSYTTHLICVFLGFNILNLDCDDSNSAINPGATEICGSGIDENCNPADDSGTDNDLDGYKIEGGLCGPIDCDDANSKINPGMPEICNGMDDNCDGNIDENLPLATYYYDADSDAYGTSANIVVSCGPPFGYIINDFDCNDNNVNINPEAQEACDGIDNNCDNTVDEGCLCTPIGESRTCGTDIGECAMGTETCTEAGWGSCTGIGPSMEICDEKDNNCNSYIDEGVLTTIYRDLDNDGYGNLLDTKDSCSIETGYTLNSNDCNDNNNLINPAAQEACDGIDNNCDGDIDTNCDCFNGQTMPCYSGPEGTLDIGICKAGQQECINGKWDICKNEIIPAQESCDSTDNDCDGSVDEDLLLTYYKDIDSDGYSDALDTITSCTQPSGYVTISGDCDDNPNDDLTQYLDPFVDLDGDSNYAEHINPSAQEIPCNFIDENCNPFDDLGTDNDKDSYFLEASCGLTDCDDNNNLINPGATDICNNGIDENCDGIDLTPTTEICDGIDNDCDDLVDEDFPNKGLSCTSGIGACQATGTYVCSADKSGTECNAVPGTPLTEICGNEIDEDCDGSDLACERVCDPNAQEECNTIDDNCDNYIDSIPIINGLLFKNPIIPSSQQILPAPSAIEVGSTNEKSITLRVLNVVDSISNPIQGARVCVESCDILNSYTIINNPPYLKPPYPVTKNVLFDKNYGITDVNGEVTFNYFVYSGENIITFITKNGISMPISFSKI